LDLGVLLHTFYYEIKRKKKMRAQRFKYLGLAFTLAALIEFGVGAATESKAAVAATEVEQVLLTSGFKVNAAKTSAQRAQLRALPDNQFTMVKQDANTYYLYPDKKDNRLYAGDQYAYRAYQGYLKNKHLRAQGVFVWEVNPADRSNNKTIQIWHDWTPFHQWQ
jgi:hypothetical protein